MEYIDPNRLNPTYNPGALGRYNTMPVDRSYLIGGGGTPTGSMQQQYAGGTPNFVEGGGPIQYGTPAPKGYGDAPMQMGPDGSPILQHPNGTGLLAPMDASGFGGGQLGYPSGGAPTGAFSPQPILRNGQTVGYMPTTSDYTNSLSPTDQQARLQTLRQSNPGASDEALQYFDTGDYYGQKGAYQNVLNRPPTQWELAAKARSDAANSNSNFWNDAGKPLALSALAAVGTGGLSIAGQAAQATQAGPASGAPVGSPNPIGGGASGIPADILGLAGGISQQNAYQGYADWARNQGQPYRDMLGASYANPSGYLSSPEVTGAVQQGTNALARSLSMQGNPVGSGGALQQLQNYSTNQQLDRLSQYRQQLGGFGGLNAINQSIPGAAGAAIDARGNSWNAGGSLLNDIFGRSGVGGGLNLGNIFGNSGSLPTPTGGVGQVDFGNDPSLGYGGPQVDFGNDPSLSTAFDPNMDWGSLYG